LQNTNESVSENKTDIKAICYKQNFSIWHDLPLGLDALNKLFTNIAEESNETVFTDPGSSEQTKPDASDDHRERLASEIPSHVQDPKSNETVKLAPITVSW